MSEMIQIEDITCLFPSKAGYSSAYFNCEFAQTLQLKCADITLKIRRRVPSIRRQFLKIIFSVSDGMVRDQNSEFDFQSVNFLNFKIPNFKILNFDFPNFKILNFDFPNFSHPSFDFPNVNRKSRKSKFKVERFQKSRKWLNCSKLPRNAHKMVRFNKKMVAYYVK